MGVGTILKLTLALMTASLFISVSTFGDLGNAVSNGMENIQDATDFTVKVDNVQTLSDAAKFVRQRAGNDGCAENNGKDFNTVPQQTSDPNNGYPALSDQYMGQYPSCSGTSSTLVRGVDGAVMEEGQDMEGIYSRVRFEVTEPIAITTSEEGDEYSGTWLEERLVGATHLSLQEATLATRQDCRDAEGSRAEFLGTVDLFVMYYAADNANNPARADTWIREFNQDELNDNFYCKDGAEDLNLGENDVLSEIAGIHPVTSATIRAENRYVLCPGDRGYIQMNKGTPQTRAETGESVWSGSARNIPFIQVTNLGPREGNSCLPSEMEPAGVFTEAKTVERIELPAETGSQIGASVPDKFENGYRTFMRDVWEDSYADNSLDWLENEASGVASTIANGVEWAVDGLTDVGEGIADFFGFGDDIDTVGEFLEEEGIDPLTDFADEARDAIVSAIDSTMKDSLHIELRFENQHLDMDDDRFRGDIAGGFQIKLYDEGTNGDLEGGFESEPPAGQWFEDVDQGEEDEMDALQQGYLDGNDGIKNLGCYVTAELFIKQKRDFPPEERPEDLWDIYIGDLGDEGSNSKSDCDNGRDGRLDGERAGPAWGGLATYEDIEITVDNYDADDEILEVTARATSNNEGDGNLDGGQLDVGLREGYSFESAKYETCQGDTCEVSGSITGISADSFPIVMAKFSRDDEEKDETKSVDLSNHLETSEVLGPETWNWNSDFNFTSGLFTVQAEYGYEEHESEAENISGSIVSLNSLEGDTHESEYCQDNTYISHCNVSKDSLDPSEGVLNLNATIRDGGAENWNTNSFEVPFGNLGDATFESNYSSDDNNFDLNVTYSSDITLLNTELEIINVTDDSTIGSKSCADSNSCKLELEGLEPESGNSFDVNATLSRSGATRYTVGTISN